MLKVKWERKRRGKQQQQKHTYTARIKNETKPKQLETKYFTKSKTIERKHRRIEETDVDTL